MNVINLYIDRIDADHRVKKHGIDFCGVVFVRILIDGESLDEGKGGDAFKDSLVYMDELIASSVASGRYLIFTCACGIAEDGGWEGVVVRHSDSLVEWEFDVEGICFNYSFDRQQYIDEIATIKADIESETLPIEPKSVIFPLNFNRSF